MTDTNARSGFQFIHVHHEGPLRIIAIDRPEVRNALHPPACAEIGRALDAIDADDAARVVIVCAADGRHFSAGFDLQYAQAHPQVYDEPLIASEIVRRPTQRKPLIAAVDGMALGLGFELALACDLIVAAQGARFGLPEPLVGLAAMGGGVVRLTRELGPKRALGLILSAETIDAEEGRRLGFVNEVCADGALAGARRWAEKIARCSPMSLTASREMAYNALDMDLATALDPRSHPAVLRLLAGEDVHEGRRAFLEKRRPEWKNR